MENQVSGRLLHLIIEVLLQSSREVVLEKMHFKSVCPRHTMHRLLSIKLVIQRRTSALHFQVINIQIEFMATNLTMVMMQVNTDLVTYILSIKEEILRKNKDHQLIMVVLPTKRM